MNMTTYERKRPIMFWFGNVFWFLMILAGMGTIIIAFIQLFFAFDLFPFTIEVIAALAFAAFGVFFVRTQVKKVSIENGKVTFHYLVGRKKEIVGITKMRIAVFSYKGRHYYLIIETNDGKRNISEIKDFGNELVTALEEVTKMTIEKKELLDEDL